MTSQFHGAEPVVGSWSTPTVDGRNPAPVDVENLPLFFSGFYTSQDFFHQQYVMAKLNPCAGCLHMFA